MVPCFCIACRSWCSFLVTSESRQEEGAREGQVKWIEEGEEKEEGTVKAHSYTKEFKEIK